MKEIKVAQLAGSVSEMSAYHHGEVGGWMDGLVDWGMRSEWVVGVG